MFQLEPVLSTRGAVANAAVACRRWRIAWDSTPNFKQQVDKPWCRGIRHWCHENWSHSKNVLDHSRRCAARRAIYAPVQRRAAATGRLEAPPPTLPWCAAAGAQFVRSFWSNWSADKPQCSGWHHKIPYHFTVSALTSTSLSLLQSLIRWTEIIDVCVLDHCRWDQLSRCPAAVWGMRCRARRTAATRRGVPGEAWYRRQPVKAWRRSRRAKRAGAAVGRGASSMHPGSPAARSWRSNCPVKLKQLLGWKDQMSFQHLTWLMDSQCLLLELY